MDSPARGGPNWPDALSTALVSIGDQLDNLEAAVESIAESGGSLTEEQAALLAAIAAVIAWVSDRETAKAQALSEQVPE